MPRAIHLKDALVTVAALARAAVHLGAERLNDGAQRALARPRSTARAMPADAGAVTPQWLTAAMQASFPGARIRSLVPLEGNRGTTDRARVRVVYDDRGTGAEPPASLFLKMRPSDIRTRLFVSLMSLGATEVRFYREIGSDVPVAVPKVLCAAVAGGAQRFVLVLEDLAARGARFTNVAEPLGLDEIRAVVSALARLHARFWESPRFERDLAWLKHRGNNPRYRVERFLCAAAVAPALRKFGDLVPPALRDAAPLLIAGRDKLEVAWAEPPLTLLHGDAHAGNMYFCGAGAPAPAVGFFDWQVVQRGQGMRDLTYFLVNSLPAEIRRAHEHELIASYTTTLAQLGVAAPSFETAWRQYRLHAVYAWIAAVVTAAAATFQAEPIVRAGLARSCAALTDLNSVGAVEELRG